MTAPCADCGGFGVFDGLDRCDTCHGTGKRGMRCEAQIGDLWSGYWSCKCGAESGNVCPLDAALAATEDQP